MALQSRTLSCFHWGVACGPGLELILPSHTVNTQLHQHRFFCLPLNKQYMSPAFTVTHTALHCHAERNLWRRNTTHLHVSLRLTPWTKDFFLAASHAGKVLQGLPRLKAEDVADVKSLSCTSLLLLTMCVTLQSPLIPLLHMGGSVLCAESRQHWTCCTLWEKVTSAIGDALRSGLLL